MSTNIGNPPDSGGGVPPAAPPAAAPAASRAEAPQVTPAPDRPADIVYHLWFEQFKQINALAVAATAGALILMQMGLVEANPVSGTAVLSMASAVLVAMHGQDSLTDAATRGVAPGRAVSRARGIAGFLLAAGAGAFISHAYFG